jgi:ferritin-like metal-binding protein YciE
MSLDTMRDLLIDEMSDIYNAEKQLVRALPKMAKASASPTLKKAFLSHLEETKGHVTRLEQAFAAMSEKPKRKKCKAMEGLVEEGAEMCAEDGEDAVRDAGLIGAAQRVEHYEVAAYGGVVAYAEALGEDKVASILSKTLKEEHAANDKLSTIAESEVNPAALAAGEEEEDDDEE